MCTKIPLGLPKVYIYQANKWKSSKIVRHHLWMFPNVNSFFFRNLTLNIQKSLENGGPWEILFVWIVGLVFGFRLTYFWILFESQASDCTQIQPTNQHKKHSQKFMMYRDQKNTEIHLFQSWFLLSFSS